MLRTPRSVLFAGAVLLASTSVAIVAGAQPAAAASCASKVASDFNGDGIADAAITDQPDGGVRVVYGTRAGLTATASRTALKNQLLKAPGVDESTNLVTGDFNGDGCADIAVNDPYATDNGVTFAGVVDVFYGSETGVSKSASIVKASLVTAAAPGRSS